MAYRYIDRYDLQYYRSLWLTGIQTDTLCDTIGLYGFTGIQTDMICDTMSLRIYRSVCLPDFKLCFSFLRPELLHHVFETFSRTTEIFVMEIT